MKARALNSSSNIEIYELNKTGGDLRIRSRPVDMFPAYVYG